MSKKVYAVFLEMPLGDEVEPTDGSIGNFDCIVGGKRYDGQIYTNEVKAKKVLNSLKDIDSKLKMRKIVIS